MKRPVVQEINPLSVTENIANRDILTLQRKSILAWGALEIPHLQPIRLDVFRRKLSRPESNRI